MNVRQIILLSVIFFFFGNFNSFATVKPSIQSLVDRSTWVIIGRVSEVFPKDDRRHVVVKTKRTLMSSGKSTAGLFNIRYIRGGKGNIDFEMMKQNKNEYLFFLKPAPATGASIGGGIETVLVDAWFGAEEANLISVDKVLRAMKKEGAGQ